MPMTGSSVTDITRSVLTRTERGAEEAAEAVSLMVMRDVPRNWSEGKAGGTPMPPLKSRRYRKRVGRSRRTLKVEGLFHRMLRRKKRKNSWTVLMRSVPHPRTGGGRGGQALSTVQLLQVQSRMAGMDVMRVSEAQKRSYARIYPGKIRQGLTVRVTGKTTIQVQF